VFSTRSKVWRSWSPSRPWHTPYRTPRPNPTGGSAELAFSLDEAQDEWDRFLLGATGGHHLQCTGWGEVKNAQGWETLRVLACRDRTICGGAQVLLRPVPALGSFGYVSHGPVLEGEDSALAELLLDGLEDVARDRNVRALVVQPPPSHEWLVPRLEARGYRPAGAALQPHPTLTVIVDLAAGENDLLSRMKSKTRYNIRLAERKGVSVRAGDERDLPTFYRLLSMTAERQRFRIPPADYFGHMFGTLSRRGLARILVAEYGQESLSAALLITFGDTVSYKRGAWSGQHGELHPNELLHWSAMRWAKAAGYRYYDFEGVHRQTDGAEPPGAEAQTVSRFKMRFGGQLVCSPTAYTYLPHPLLRWGFDRLSRVSELRAARSVVDVVRTA
jgi:lipid II:glycine glycyltransferase (peptidoglycan interpeptide bridge formation enzyme)